jgi:hypothetical protein
MGVLLQFAPDSRPFWQLSRHYFIPSALQNPLEKQKSGESNAHVFEKKSHAKQANQGLCSGFNGG